MEIRHFLPGQEIPDFDHQLLISQQADEHITVGQNEARCSLWWTVTPQVDGERPGIIGHFQASSQGAGLRVLEEACRRLRTAGCCLAIGPMDGNTWRRYRVLTERGAEPPFFMEPDNPDTWPQIFEGVGFAPLSVYTSSLVSDLTRQDPRADRVKERLHADGITIRQLDPAHFADELRRIYEVSVISFTQNYLYTELSEDAFVAQYLPYREKIRPELVFLAEDQGKPVGYLFAIPDYAEALRGEPIRTVIGKTLAVLPGRRYAGLGLVLVSLLHESSHTLGYQRLIHALQHEGNNKVRNMSGYFGQVMRRYTLYSRALA